MGTIGVKPPPGRAIGTSPDKPCREAVLNVYRDETCSPEVSSPVAPHPVRGLGDLSPAPMETLSHRDKAAHGPPGLPHWGKAPLQHEATPELRSAVLLGGH